MVSTAGCKMRKIFLLLVIIMIFQIACVSTTEVRHRPDVKDDWYYHNGHTYAYVPVGKKWPEARRLCENVGGHLVVFETMEEMRHVYSIIQNLAWIGLTDEVQEGTFLWVNGAKLSFQSWNKGEPNDAGASGEDCVGAKPSTGWVDLTAAESTHHFICEFDFIISNAEKIEKIQKFLYGLSNEKITLTDADKAGTAEASGLAIPYLVPVTLTATTPVSTTTDAHLVNSDRSSLPRVAVMDFRVDNISRSEANMVIDLMSNELHNTGKYSVLERSQRDDALLEIQFSVSDVSDEATQLRAGKLLSAEMIAIGSIGKVGSRIAVNIKLVRVETGMTVLSATELYDSIDSLVDGIKPLVRKLLQSS